MAREGRNGETMTRKDTERAVGEALEAYDALHDCLSGFGLDGLLPAGIRDTLMTIRTNAAVANDGRP